jgi:hypothetical protein
MANSVAIDRNLNVSDRIDKMTALRINHFTRFLDIVGVAANFETVTISISYSLGLHQYTD